MRLHVIWTIFRKEIREALRDRLTLIVMLGLPIVIYPLVVTSLARIQRTQEATEDKRISQVAVWGQAIEPLIDFLQRTNKIKLERSESPPVELEFISESTNSASPQVKTNSNEVATESISLNSTNARPNPVRDAARDVLNRKEADAVLVLWPGTQEALDELDLGRVTIFYDSIRPASVKARERLHDELTSFRKQLVAERQKKLNLPEGFATGLEIRSANVASLRKEFGDRFGRLLPMLLILLSATGALYAAVDLTAGEKDRATMQTLLCAPVLPLEIVAGKFLTVWCISLVSALANILSLSLTITRVAASVSLPAIPLWMLLGVLGLVSLVTCTVAAAFIGVAALARDAKDAGNFLSGALILLTLPVAASIMPGVELNTWTAFVPLVNISLLIRSVFVEGLNLNIFFLTIIASSGYALLALLFAAKVFGREEILLGGSVSLRHLLPGQRGVRAPTPGVVLAAFVLVLVAAFYGSLLVEKKSFTVSILAIQFGFFLLPALAIAAINRYPWKETFSLRAPHWKSVLGAILIGVSGGTAVAGLTLRLLPPPDSLMEGLKDALLLGGGGASLWVVLLVLAVTPAVCEEAFFRGLTLSGLRRLGPWAAIGISALLFGLAHASIYRLLPTLVLGIVLGYAAWRSRSIFCSMIVHAVNNGFIATLVHFNAETKLSLGDTEFVPWPLTLSALAVMLSGLILIRPPAGEKPATETRE